MFRNLLVASVCLTALTGFGPKSDLITPFYANDVQPVSPNFVSPDAAEVEVFLTGLQLKFLESINLQSVDLCDANLECSRLNITDMSTVLSGDVFLSNGSFDEEVEIESVAFNIRGNNGKTYQLVTTELSETLNLEYGRRRALFLSDLKFQGRNVTLSDVGSGYVPPSYDYITAIEPGELKYINIEEDNLRLRLKSSNKNAPLVILGSYQTNALGEIRFNFNYLDDARDVARLEFKINDPDLRPGGLSSVKTGELNGQPTELKFIGFDKQKNQKYRVDLSESGFFYLRNKNEMELPASLRTNGGNAQTGFVKTPQDFSNLAQRNISNLQSVPTQLNLATANDCAQEIAAIGAQAFYNVVINSVGGILLSNCNVNTKLHIVIQDTNRPGFDVDYFFNAPLASSERLTETVNEHVGASPRFLSLNAWTWDGNRGFRFDSDPSGTPDADQFVNGTQISSSSAQQVLMGFTDPARFTNAIPFFLDKPANTTGVPSTVFNHDVVGSTSSIIKSSVCNPNNTTVRDRRNAMGVVDRGGRRYLVTIQTRTGEEIGVNEMCDVFLALEVPDAMQLDGGSAAQMVIDGILINPLETFSLKWFALGQQRRVISALSMGL